VTEPSDTLDVETISAELRALAADAELVIFVAETCPHCANAVRQAEAVARASPRVTVSVIDAQQSPELAARYSVKSVPTTMLDGGLSWVGVEGAARIAERVLARGTADHERAVFASLVESGRHGEAIERIVDGGEVAHFAALWVASTTSTRIGLMLVAEGALERRPDALHETIDALLPALESADAALRGDTADLIGQTGNPAGLEALRPLLDDPNPDVAEIAAEALGLDEG
jgi:thioredoxin-like negative regulator of GroEL